MSKLARTIALRNVKSPNETVALGAAAPSQMWKNNSYRDLRLKFMFLYDLWFDALHGLFFSVCKEEHIDLPKLQNHTVIRSVFLHSGFPPIFLCLDCGFMMCYGIYETTVKPDVLSNASMYSLNNFAEVELRAHHVVAVRTLCHLSFLVRPLFPFKAPLKISPLPLAQSSLVTDSHQAN